MDVLSVNAEAKLIALALSVRSSPQSWGGWSCLRITLNDLNENIQHECLFWARSLLDAYLKEAEGRIYFCENSAIHIVCKSVPIDVLGQAGQQICDLVYSESSVRVEYHIHDLLKDGEACAEKILEQKTNIFDYSGSNREGADHCAEKIELSDMIKPHVNDTKIDAEHTKVLLVEDDPVTRWLVRNALKGSCDFATASTANKAFSLYSIHQPDVVFLDINLPDKNGYEVLEWIMRNDPGANVVMFSGQSHMDNIMEALEIGARGFIGKPFIKEQFLDYIHGSA
ncbi:MAG: response regulator [Alphaproteobacteria bacterium]